MDDSEKNKLWKVKNYRIYATKNVPKVWFRELPILYRINILK